MAKKRKEWTLSDINKLTFAEIKEIVNYKEAADGTESISLIVGERLTLYADPDVKERNKVTNTAASLEGSPLSEENTELARSVMREVLGHNFKGTAVDFDKFIGAFRSTHFMLIFNFCAYWTMEAEGDELKGKKVAINFDLASPTTGKGS